jgi:uncharacterized RDD family membrane protein YckC
VAEYANPYAAPKAALERDTEKKALPELASRRDRFAAAFIDGILVIFAGLTAMLSPIAFFAALAGLAAWNLWTVHKYRASLGKRFIGLRVLRSDGSEASTSRIVFLRWLPATAVGAIPYIGWLALIDVLLIFRENRRCVHDLIADTVVVDA